MQADNVSDRLHELEDSSVGLIPTTGSYKNHPNPGEVRVRRLCGVLGQNYLRSGDLCD
ncbi:MULTISPECIES: hypothetical protein [Planktothricoides]|uniref:Uncharacterized protein n=2 Tax=Planktothricoides raciborskii TaxID=132608 RepID=A0AAU8JI04_9CYAN|nr:MULTISPECIES: hypothetical protein [Planktothricoides]MBD2542592.1 hypothetical protein [Planktothricoides raciborskii FACHB-1370]MBD2581050.1 hypothetical protein [Planktothricoides raciborskii FACHB-1261]